MNIDLPQPYKKHLEQLKTMPHPTGLTVDGDHLALTLSNFGLPEAETIKSWGNPSRISIHWNTLMKIAAHCGALEILGKYGMILSKDDCCHYQEIDHDLKEKLIEAARNLSNQASALITSGVTIQTPGLSFR